MKEKITNLMENIEENMELIHDKLFDDEYEEYELEELLLFFESIKSELYFLI